MGKTFEEAIDDFSVAMGEKICWLYALVVIISIWEIFMRYVFNDPTEWVHETVTFIVGFCLLLGNNYCMSRDSHMRVDLLYSNAGPKLKYVLEIFNTTAQVILFALLVYVSFLITQKAWFTPLGELRLQRTGSPLNPPYPALLKLLLLLSCGLAFFKSVTHLVSTLRKGVK